MDAVSLCPGPKDGVDKFTTKIMDRTTKGFYRC